MNIQSHIDAIIGHLGAAAIQRSFYDDAIIASHIDEALEAAKLAKRELTQAKETA